MTESFLNLPSTDTVPKDHCAQNSPPLSPPISVYTTEPVPFVPEKLRRTKAWPEVTTSCGSMRTAARAKSWEQTCCATTPSPSARSFARFNAAQWRRGLCSKVAGHPKNSKLGAHGRKSCCLACVIAFLSRVFVRSQDVATSGKLHIERLIQYLQDE